MSVPGTDRRTKALLLERVWESRRTADGWLWGTIHTVVCFLEGCPLLLCQLPAVGWVVTSRSQVIRAHVGVEGFVVALLEVLKKAQTVTLKTLGTRTTCRMDLGWTPLQY